MKRIFIVLALIMLVAAASIKYFFAMKPSEEEANGLIQVFLKKHSDVFENTEKDRALIRCKLNRVDIWRLKSLLKKPSSSVADNIKIMSILSKIKPVKS